MNIEHTLFDDGIVICGSCLDQEVLDLIKNHLNQEQISLIYTDPPYGNILDNEWDKTKLNQEQFVEWMFSWVDVWANFLQDQAPFYIWGGVLEKKASGHFFYSAPL